jgi:hypothetical protein
MGERRVHDWLCVNCGVTVRACFDHVCAVAAPPLALASAIIYGDDWPVAVWPDDKGNAHGH